MATSPSCGGNTTNKSLLTPAMSAQELHAKGLLYHKKKDYCGAFPWYKKAANQGYPDAKYKYRKAIQRMRAMRRKKELASRPPTPKYQPTKTKAPDPVVTDPWKAAGALLGIFLKYQDFKNENSSTNSGYTGTTSSNQGESAKAEFKKCWNNVIDAKRLVFCQVTDNGAGYQVVCDGKSGLELMPIMRVMS